MKLVAITVLFSLAWGSGALRATPIATEDFDYTVGGAAPMDGGSGWGEPWKDSGGTVNAALTLAAGSLNPLGQLAVGNRLSPSGSTFFRKLSTAAAAAVAAEGTANGEVWVSFTAQQTTAASGTGGMALWNAGSTTFTDSSNNYSLMLVRNTWDGGDWSWTDVTTVGAGSLGTVPVTTAVRYVMRLDFQATQTAATMYVFTSSSQIGADIASSTPATTVSGNITNASGNRPVFDRIRLSGNNGLVFDSVRIATTFAEVMPVAATPPTITVPPTPATASEFDRHTFSVTAAGSTPLSFQWKKGSQTLDGQTSSILTLDNLGFSDAGSYSVTVTNAYGSAESDPVNLTVTTYPRDLTASAALIARLLPNQADHFVVEFVAPSNGLDVYEVEGLGEKVVLRGNTSVSVASALNHYLTQFCGCHLSRCGDQLALPAPLPLVPAKVRVVSPHRIRYFYNPCTYGYTTAWWGWDKWEREIDLLALQGINMAQVTPGTEEVFRRTLRDHFGYTDAEVRAWLCMPSHLPWMLLANMHSFGGPVPAAVVDARAVLGRKICDRMRALGIAPVAQGFYGMVPQDFKTRYPTADVRSQGSWAGGFGRPDMLNPVDPLYTTFCQHYYAALTDVLGPLRYFAADPFHEGGSTSGIDLAVAAQSILAGMSQAHSEAVWVLEAWGSNPLQTMLDAVDKQRLLVLDLDCTTTETWRSRSAFNNTPWVWCAIQNFGGNTGMDAALTKLATMPVTALNDASRGPMTGVGMVPEGCHTIPAAYDLFFGTAWTGTTPNLTQWTRDYARRRYGTRNAALEAAWELRLQTSDNPGAGSQEPHNSIVGARPSLSTTIKARTWGSTEVPYRASGLAGVWEKMLSASAQASTSDGFRFDLADAARQVLCDLATRHQRLLAAAYTANDAAGVHTHGDRILEILADLDTLCASRKEFLLGAWLADARSWGSTAAEEDLCERSARLLVTTWGDSVSDLNDYANREWAGLISGFYRPRWQQFLTALYAAADQSATFNETTVRSQIGAWELTWTLGHESYAATPTGDTVSIATALWAKYGAEAGGDFDLVAKTVGTTWSPTICSTTPVKWTRNVAADITSTGVWCVTFQYTSGNHGLQIHEVSLADGATVVDRDVHPGWTGAVTYDNRYYLRVTSLPAAPVLTIIANSAGGTDSAGTLSLARCDVVTVGGTWSATECATARRVWQQDVTAALTTNGDWQVTATRNGGSSNLTIDRVWIEQNGVTRGQAVADETLDATNSVARWTVPVANLITGQPVTLRLATGSASTAGSTGSIVLAPVADTTLPEAMSWPRWAADHFIDAAHPDHDGDHDGSPDLFEFLTGSDPSVPGALQPLTLGASGQLTLRLAADRTGADIRIECSDNLLDWAAASGLDFSGQSAGPGGTIIRTYTLPEEGVGRFLRLKARPSP